MLQTHRRCKVLRWVLTWVLRCGLEMGFEVNADGCCCCLVLLLLMIVMMTLGAVTTRLQVLLNLTSEEALHVWHVLSMNLIRFRAA